MLFFLEMLNTILLFHWNTTSYAAHKASDKLYRQIQPLIDKFIEIGLEKRVPAFEEKIEVSYKTLPKFKTYLKQCIFILTELPLQNDMGNVRDDMVAEIHQFLYLANLRE